MNNNEINSEECFSWLQGCLGYVGIYHKNASQSSRPPYYFTRWKNGKEVYLGGGRNLKHAIQNCAQLYSPEEIIKDFDEK